MQSYLRSISSKSIVEGLNYSTVAHTTSVIERQNVTSTRLPADLVSDGVLTAIGTVLTVLFVFGLAENVSVLFIYCKNKRLQGVANYWICAILVCDLLLVINAIPYTALSSFMRINLFGEIGCQYDGFVVTFLGTTSIFLFTGLSVHRHYIMMGNQSCRTLRKSTVIKCITFCFMFGTFWGVCPLLGWGTFALEGVGLSCAPDWRSNATRDVTYTVAMYICVLFLPLIIIGYCYSRILFKIWRETRMQSDWINQRRVRRDIRVTVSVALTLLAFIISWTPYAVVSFLEAFCDADLISTSPLLVQLPCLVAKAACIWNPLVYICHNSQFRIAFLEMYKCMKRDKIRSVQLSSAGESPQRGNIEARTAGVDTPMIDNEGRKRKKQRDNKQKKVTRNKKRSTRVTLNGVNGDVPDVSTNLIRPVVQTLQRNYPAT